MAGLPPKHTLSVAKCTINNTAKEFATKGGDRTQNKFYVCRALNMEMEFLQCVSRGGACIEVTLTAGLGVVGRGALQQCDTEEI